MLALPIDAELPRILDAIRESRSAVVVAEPGAGKTTRLPPAVLRAGLLPDDAPNLIMLQPRRVAARLAAARIAEEQNWSLGNEVGYQIRFERRMTEETRLRIVTEGILTRQLLDDSYLPGVGCVVLDEFHERNLNSDLAIAMLRELRASVRPDLILIVMSATLDAGPVSKFLGDAPILQSPGRTFPIDIQYRAAPPNDIERSVADAVRDALALPGKDILVFLPGAGEIARTQSLLEGLPTSGSGEHGRTVGGQRAAIFPLHGSLPTSEQDRALAPSGCRKVILATNIAETSLTIPGVDMVIDAGLQRLPAYDPSRGMDRLELRRISKASATQRAGRAGRTGPGKAIRLWSAKQHEALDNFQPAEVHRVDLSSAVLSLHAWGASDARKFDWFETPGERSLGAAENLLQLLGAIASRPSKNPRTKNDSDVQVNRGVQSSDRAGDAPALAGTDLSQGYEITALGRRMLALPLPVRLARLMLDAHAHGLTYPAASIAAMLSDKDSASPRGPAETAGDSDLLHRLNFHPSPQLAKTRDQLLRLLPPSSPGAARASRHEGAVSRPSDEHLLKLLLLAYPDRVVRRRASDPNSGIIVGGVGVRLAAESIVRRGEFYIAVDVQSDDRSRKSEALVRAASRIERQWLVELFPDFIHSRRVLAFDESRQKVIEKNQTVYRDLVLNETEDNPTDLVAAGILLGESLRPRAAEFFDGDPAARQWLARLALLRRAMPEQPWPTVDKEALADLICTSAQNRRAVDQLPQPGELLQSTLPYPLDRLFETHAPPAMLVPTGNRISIDYTSPTGPVLAVRLQELFGLAQTPVICAGRVPLTLHLLGPNYRPVQITNDLPSFWKNAYFQVRKDLKARYPKHSWPENPLTAPPQAKGRRSR